MSTTNTATTASTTADIPRTHFSGVVERLPPHVRQMLVAASVMLAAIIQILDTTIANVALPHMQGALSATEDQISWVLTSYIITAAIVMPMTGYISGRFGRKRMLVWSVAGFTIASALCGMAQSLPEAVIARMLQGVFGACLVPVSQSILLDIFPREQHAKAMSLWGIGVMVAPILGPTIGGWLTEYYSWRWAFYINLPVGILSLFGIITLVHESDTDSERRFDVFGFFVLSISIGALQLMLDRGRTLYWFESKEIIAEAIVSAVAFYMFVVHMFTHSRPFIEPALFKDRNFCVSMVLIFFVGVVLLATLALLPPFLQNLIGYSVLDAGLILAPRGAGTMLGMIFVTRMMGKIDARFIIALGGVFTCASLWLMTSFTLDVSKAAVVWVGFLQGVGLGFIFVPLSTVAFLTLDPALRTEGSAIYSLVRNIGSSIGISVVMTALADNVQRNHAIFSEHITPFNHWLDWGVVPQIWNTGTTQGLMALDGELLRQAAQLAYLQDFQLILWMTLIIVPLALFMKTDGAIDVSPNQHELMD
ncbi:MAG TPA: DHA2 family efflux MFS transporter permease subunit [Pseudomonadales bacterium]|jgi:DHA2 family multidrug resistance protein|nr:DHA2 family efflux MFS transporter permease subunit [Pseudomonadales bacterium]